MTWTVFTDTKKRSKVTELDSAREERASKWLKTKESIELLLCTERHAKQSYLKANTQPRTQVLHHPCCNLS